jgi:hypothetical protein
MQIVLVLYRVPETGPQAAEAKLRAAKEKEAAKFAAEAAYRQRIGETIDWLGSAKISLLVSPAPPVVTCHVLKAGKTNLGWKGKTFGIVLH